MSQADLYQDVRASTIEVTRPQAATALPFDGERYTTALGGTIEQEHLHRYLFALPFCRSVTVLDIACGEGYGTALLGTVAARVVGVDISAEAIAHARRTYGQDSDAQLLEFHIGSCDAIPLPDGCIDVVVSFETIEHISAHAAFLLEIRRVLRPDGTLIMSTPDLQVYSVENGVRNPYHVQELSRADFQATLAGCFQHVSMLGQKVTAGSLIGPLSELATAATLHPVQIISHSAAASYTLAPHVIGAPFLVAVASDKPFAPLPISMLDEPGYVPQLEQIVVPRIEAENAMLRAQINQLTKALAQARAGL